jgi:hypothetical protein
MRIATPPPPLLSGKKYHKYEILFSYLMVVGAIDWNICPEVMGMTKGSITRGHRQDKCSSLLHLKPLNNRFIT